MKNILFPAVLILFFFIIPLKQISASEWLKYDQNPILSNEKGWELNSSSPTVVFDNNKFKMWYQASVNNKLSFNYAESNDGINWTKHNNNPVFAIQDNDSLPETGIVEPSVIKNDKYRLWYNSQNNTIYKIRYASSSDGINWSKHADYVLTGESDWEVGGVANPSIVYKDGKYLMWYMGHGSLPWSIGYAESTDGINWIKHQNNPLILPSLGHVGGQSVIFSEGKYHMFYHTGSNSPTAIYHVISTDGINWDCDGDCLILSISQGFDSSMIVYPEAVEHNSNLYLYYAGYDGNTWQIGLATPKPIVLTKRNPVIIIPGLFASWNKQALVYNQAVNQSDWKMNPYVHEYEGIIQTLKNIGYEENKDYFIFNYDWRKPLEATAENFNSYVNQISTEPTDKVNIIGHSLGGLIGRIYAQKFGVNKVNKIVTVGSPHKGVSQAYKTVEAGEIDRFNNYIWLGSKILLQLYRDGIKTDKQIINERMQIMKDLLPTFIFLKNISGQEITVSNMKIKNDTLLQYSSSLPDIYPIITSFIGEKGDTPFGFKVSQRSILDKLLDNYPDGRPIESITSIGDYVVPSISAKLDNNKILNADHSGLIYKKDSIKEILTSLDIPYQENHIFEGRPTTISPSILFLVLSPVELKVKFNNDLYSEKDGLIFVENALPGNYQLELKGKEKGTYKVLIGQIGKNSEQWSSIDGEIVNNDPSSQIDKYEIDFNQADPSEIPANLNSVIKSLIKINSRLNNKNINISVKYLTETKKYSSDKKFTLVRLGFEKAIFEIFKARRDVDQTTKVKLLEIIDKLENLYSYFLKTSRLPVFERKLKTELNIIKKSVNLTEQYLLLQMKFGKNITNQALMLKLVEEKVNKVEINISKKNYYSAEIALVSIKLLLKEIK